MPITLKELRTIMPSGLLDSILDPYDAVGDGDETSSVERDLLKLANAVEAYVKKQHELPVKPAPLFTGTGQQLPTEGQAVRFWTKDTAFVPGHNGITGTFRDGNFRVGPDTWAPLEIVRWTSAG